VANGRDIGYVEKRDDIQERYQDDIYTSTTFKSGSNKHNQYLDTTTSNNQFTAKQQSGIKHNKHIPSSPLRPPPSSRHTNKEEEVEDYITTTSPIIQRSKARQIERNSFLDWADSQLGYKVSSTTTKDGGRDRDNKGKDGGSKDVRGERSGEGSVRDNEGRDGGRSTRIKKLWDFNNIDTSYVKVDDNREDEQRDDNNDNISMYKPTSSIRDLSSTTNTNFNSSYTNLTNSINLTNSNLNRTNSSKKKEVWTASKIRQESRHDITKQLNVDLTEIEMFMSSMKERIKLYGTASGGKDGGGKEGRVAVKDGSDKGSEKEKGLGGVRGVGTNGKNDDIGEIDKLQLTHTQSSSEESIPTDDGYGKQVRSPHYTTTSHKSFNGNNNHEINNLINKFQSTRMKQSRHYLVQGDELMNSSTTNTNIDDRVGEHRTYREPIMTMEKQAIKIATYTGMNQQDDMTSSSGKDGGGKEGRVAVKDGSDKGSEKEKGLGGVRGVGTNGKNDDIGEIDKLQLTHTQSSSEESIPTDDGYGKQVRSPHYTTTSHKSFNGNNNHEINNLINKFQSTRIKQSRHYLVQGDELMNSSTTNTNIDDRVGEHRTYREPIMTMEKQAIKIATYTGMNQQDDMTKKDNGSSRRAIAKKSGYDYTISSPREVRLKRMQELKKKHQLVIDQDEKNEPPPPPPKEDDKKDIDTWWDEHKLKHDQKQQRYDKDQGCRRGMDTNYNIDDELERWWKEKRRNDTPNKTPFAELEEEPTISDPDQSTFTPSTIKGTPTLPPLSPMNTIPTKRELKGSSSTSSSSSSKPKNISHLTHTFRLKSRQLGSPLPVQRGSSSSIDGPLLPSTTSESSTLTDENIDRDVEDAKYDQVEERSASSSSSSLSILSEGAIEEDEEDRCQSLAQSTLSMLLSRIDEAKASFTQALLDGDTVKQAELASLLSRLGEAAVTMRKLEQTA